MKAMINLIIWKMAVCLFFAVAGCAGEVDDMTSSPYDHPASAQAALSAKAVPYDDAAEIDLFIKYIPDDEFLPLNNGDHVRPGIKTLGITVHGGTQTCNDIIISNGSTYRLKAKLEGDYYTCRYNIDSGSMIQVILVQAMHPNGTASKKKIVLRTDLLIQENSIVYNGMDMLISAGFLDRLKDMLPGMVPTEKFAFSMNRLAPAAQSDRERGAVMQVDLDLFRIPVSADIGLRKDTETYGIPPIQMMLADNTVGKGIFSLSLPAWCFQLLDLYPLEVPPIDFALDDLIAIFETKSSVFEIPDWIMDLMINGDFIDVEKKHMLFGVYGLPEQTTDDAVAMGGWFFPLDNETIFLDNDFQRVEIQDSMTLSPESLKGDLRLNLSQYSLNQVINQLIREERIKIDSQTVQRLFSNILSEVVRQNSFETYLKFNPSGIGLVMEPSGPRLVVNDVQVTLEQNQEPVWTISMDMQFAFDFQMRKDVRENEKGLIETHSMLDFYLTMIPEHAYCHEMYDNLGMGMIDHTGIMSIFFEEIQKQFKVVPGGPFFSLDISRMGFEFDQVMMSYQDGQCFLDVAIGDETDFSGIAGMLSVWFDTYILKLKRKGR